MMSPPRSLAALSLIAFFFALSSSREAVVFAPEEGSALTKTFGMEGVFELEELSVVVDGEDMAEALGSFEVTVDAVTSIVVTDTYAALGEGRPRKLVRSFDRLGASSTLTTDSDVGGESEETRLSSALEGETVVFTLDEETAGYTVAFAPGEGDEELLEELEEEMDLRFLLPGGEVAVGDTWEVPVRAFSRLLLPGGTLGWTAEDEPEAFGGTMEGFGDALFAKLDELLAGECTCTFKGTTAGIAVIEIHLEVGSALDVSELLRDLAEDAAAKAGQELPIEIEVADLNLDVEAQGVLRWNTTAGHLQDFELSSDGLLGIDLALSGEIMGEALAAEITVEVSTSMKHTVGVE